MKWIKKGLIFRPNQDYAWMQSHAALPFAKCIDSTNDIFRIFFCGRNSENKSQIGYVELDLYNPTDVRYISPEPVLKLGKLGTFDDSAVMPSWLIENAGSLYLYYIGWTQGNTVPYISSNGLAISTDDGKSFEKYSLGPMWKRNDIDPYNTASACVIREDKLWRIYYLSVFKWIMENNKPKPLYHIKYAESQNGIDWDRNGIVAIDHKSSEEWAISRPCVIKVNNGYEMYYSYSGYQGKAYRIGHAISKDGLSWVRKDDQIGIDVSSAEWETDMIEFPFVFKHKSKYHMLYNGNQFGKDGFGLAIMDE